MAASPQLAARAGMDDTTGAGFFRRQTVSKKKPTKKPQRPSKPTTTSSTRSYHFNLSGHMEASLQIKGTPDQLKKVLDFCASQGIGGMIWQATA